MSITMTLQTAEIEPTSKCPICSQEIVGISASSPGEHYYTCGHEATNDILSDIIQTPPTETSFESSIWELLTGIPVGITVNNNLWS